MRNKNNIFFLQQFSHSPFISKLTKEEAKSRFTVLADFYIKGQKPGILKDFPTDVLILIVSGITHSTIKNIIDACLDINVNDYLEEIFHCLWDAIRA